MFQKISGRTAAALLALPVVLALAACAPGPKDEPEAGGRDESSPATEEAFMEWQFDYSACMREQGIDMPDPTAGGAVQAIDPSKVDMAAFEAADTACVEELGAPPVPEGPSEEEIREQQLELTKCLREQGIDIDDPKPGEGLGLPSISDEVAKACGLGAPAEGAE